MEPLHYDLRYPAAKDTTITLAAMAPSNLDAAMTMRFATSGCKPASLDAHGNTKRQQSCSHYTGVCNQRIKKRIELRTHEQPFVAAHSGGTDYALVRAPAPAAHTRYLSSPTLHGKTHGFVLRLPAQLKAHATFMQPLQCHSIFVL